jgi:1-acyl-sn-glycerol-3-phosphate acyltransferase
MGPGAAVVYVFRYLLIVLYTVFWATVAVVSVLFDRSGEAVVWCARRWVDWIFWSCGIEVECDGLEHIDPQQPYVFMTNHQSVFDTATLIATLPVSWRFVAKRELTWIPFFGWALRAGGHVIIDRSDRSKAVASLERAAARVRAGTNVTIFPEGTRSRTGELGEFKSGGFHLAIQAGVPILPASISGSNHITPTKSLRIESGRIRIRYGVPIPTADVGIDDRGALKERVRRAIQEGLDSELQSAPATAA